MYRLQIMGPRGRRIYEWDPSKLEAKDPSTLATFAEADRLLKEAMANGQMQPNRSKNAEVHIAVSGRWTA